MPTNRNENLVTSAQENYFKGDFQEATDELRLVLDSDEVCSLPQLFLLIISLM